MTDLLFNKADWHSVQRGWKQKLAEEISSYDGNKLLNTPVEDLCGYFEEKYRLEVPILNRDEISAKQRESKIDVTGRPDYFNFGGGCHLVDGVAVTVTVPFEGEKIAFDIQPTSYTLNPPRASVYDNYICLTFSGTKLDAKSLRNEIDRELASIDQYLETLRKNADGFNSSIFQEAKERIEKRREKLLENQDLVASLGFNIHEREDTTRTYTAPTVRKKISPKPPQASSAPYTPEPVLSDTDYNQILSVLDSMADVMERSPSAFIGMNEEALRTLFLVPLNSHFEGAVSGETFNHTGKTDILIRVRDKNVFIAECKFWGGAKKLLATLDQILSYSSWRDTKVAVIVFNKNKDFTKVLEVIKQTVPGHPNFKREKKPRSETSFQYVFSHLNDSSREMIVTVLAYEVPS